MNMKNQMIFHCTPAILALSAFVASVVFFGCKQESSSSPVPPATIASPQEPAAPIDLTKYTSEEAVNIAVYQNCNRSVVNIQTVLESVDMFLGPVSGEGSGSGWVYDRFGHIVTNYHVIEDADRIQVTLYDGQAFAATVVGVDRQNDIAVLHIEAEEESLFPLTLGDSSKLVVGQKALAIGNPFGLERTLTVGIISSLDRTLESKARQNRLIKSVIQIDAALNQGNSGGPLFNNAGHVIGMNTAIASVNQAVAQNSGVGFAVPVNTIRRVVPELMEKGRVVRATAGIFKVMPTRGGGLMISLLEPNGPAERAGLKGALSVVLGRRGNSIFIQGVRQNREPGDIITAVNGVAVNTQEALLEEIERHKPGTEIELTILRGRRESKVSVTLTEDPG